MSYRPIALRVEEVPDDAVNIVRGGALTVDTAERAALRNRRIFGFLGLSVEAALDAGWETVCRVSPRLAGRYGTVRLSSAGRLRGAGFPLFPTGDRPHYDVVLADLTAATVARLPASFDEPVENPGKSAHPEGRYPR